MLIKKALLAAAAVMTLAVPAAAMAQDFGGYGYPGESHAEWRDGPPAGHWSYERARDFEWRQIEREREIAEKSGAPTSSTTTAGARMAAFMATTATATIARTEA